MVWCGSGRGDGDGDGNIPRAAVDDGGGRRFEAPGRVRGDGSAPESKRRADSSLSAAAAKDLPRSPDPAATVTAGAAAGSASNLGGVEIEPAAEPEAKEGILSASTEAARAAANRLGSVREAGTRVDAGDAGDVMSDAANADVGGVAGDGPARGLAAECRRNGGDRGDEGKSGEGGCGERGGAPAVPGAPGACGECDERGVNVL